MVSSSKMVVKVLLLISAVCSVMASAIAGDIVGNNNNNNNNDVQAAEMARYNAQLQFNSFTRTYNKRYDTVEETLKRFEIFQKNVEWINKKNAEQSSFTVAVNQFADMTQDEVRSHLTGAINFGGNMSRPLSASHAIPTDVDWRAKGAVTPVQNEGPCGSTWAFSPISAIESANFIKTNKLVQLSVGQQMDCGSEFGSQGCNGGYPDGVYKFGVKYGICTDADYPYNPSSQGVCKRTCKPAVWLSGYVSLKASETDLLTSVASVPVNVNMDASCQSFTYYQSGVLDDPSCSRLVNHCITAVGYGTDSASGKDYWIFKNMWGAQWGDQGYIKLVRGKNQCGIVTSADFPNGYPVVA